MFCQATFRPDQLNRPGTVTEITLSSGHVVRVKTTKLAQFRHLGGFPEQWWTESEAAKQVYDRWVRKIAPFVTCTINQEELAQLRAEMEALEVPLPAEDKAAWIGYICADNPHDLEQIVRALAPRVT